VSHFVEGEVHHVISHLEMMKMTQHLRASARNFRRSMTNAERVLWSHVRNRRLDGFKIRRQVVLCGFIADFYCPEVKLIIEVDGEIHHEEATVIKDAHREQVLTACGYSIIRFTNPDVLHHTDKVCKALAQRLHSLRRYPSAK